MTESTDNNNQNNENPQSQLPEDQVNNASNDLSNAAEEAMRLLKQSQDDAVKKSATDVDDNGNTTNDLQQEALKAMQIQAEKQRDDEANARLSGETAVFNSDMRLKLESPESGEPIIKAVNGELIVGRADNVTDYIPDIDLAPHGAYRLGLSRRHAIILREGDKLLVKDLNSRNGTFVNGTIVPGGGTSIIQDGDEVRFGNLAMQVTFKT